MAKGVMRSYWKMAKRYFALYGLKLLCVTFMLALIYYKLFGDLEDKPYRSTVFSINDDLKTSSTDTYENSFNSSRESFDLIINTYMRSGSTFVGKIFSIRPDTFYVFEPWWNAQKFAYYRGRRDICHYNEDRCGTQGDDAVAKNIGKDITLKESIAFLEGLFDCTFQEHEKFLPDSKHFPKEFPTELHSWNFYKGPLWEPYLACAAMQQANYKQCMSLMRPVCKGAKHKVMKILRTTLDNLETLLNSRTNLKIIHLFRDPRGIVNSHLHTGFYSKKVQTESQIVNDIKTTCNRMRYDFKTALRLRKLYTDRFRIVQYEDFSDLHHSARVLYSFMEMDLTPKIASDLEQLIKPDNSSTGFHPYNYRLTLPWNVERIANTYCKDLFLSLGYPVFKDENDYRNFDEKPNGLPYAIE